VELIHYGASQYNPELFDPISDRVYRNKPCGGLWTSPIDSEYGWKDWSGANDYGDLSEHFVVKFSGSMIIIDSYKDMLEMPWVNHSGRDFISFQAYCPGYFEYDAIHLTAKGEEETRFSHPKDLYGWDCETVLILNPESIC
jgi:hypothetical protein